MGFLMTTKKFDRNLIYLSQTDTKVIITFRPKFLLVASLANCEALFSRKEPTCSTC